MCIRTYVQVAAVYLHIMAVVSMYSPVHVIVASGFVAASSNIFASLPVLYMYLTVSYALLLQGDYPLYGVVSIILLTYSPGMKWLELLRAHLQDDFEDVLWIDETSV